MKKIVGTIAAIALAASSAFAGVGIGGFGRFAWMPVEVEGGSASSQLAYGWTGNNGRVGVNLHAESENAGFMISLKGEDWALDEDCYIWAKPFSWLEVKMGYCKDDSGRGNGGFGSEDLYRMGVADMNDDLTFSRFKNKKAVDIKITPVEGLWIVAYFDLDGAADSLENVYAKRAVYGAGYDINGIGHIRAKYNCEAKEINAAFDLKAVENLTLSVGAFIPVDSDATKIAAFAHYNMDALTLHAADRVTLGSGFKNEAAVGVDYDLGNGIGCMADVRLENTKDNMSMSFMAGAKKGLTNGNIAVALEAAIKNLQTTSTFNFYVPVVLTTYF